MSHTAGIDIGSITAKAAVMRDGTLLGTRVIFTGYNSEAAGRRVFEELLGELGLTAAAIGRIVATGYGRKSVTIADKALTEIMCHAAGAHYLDPSVRSLIDIGGQDSKAVIMDEPIISILPSGRSSTSGDRTAKPSSWTKKGGSRTSR